MEATNRLFTKGFGWKFSGKDTIRKLKQNPVVIILNVQESFQALVEHKITFGWMAGHAKEYWEIKKQNF